MQSIEKPHGVIRTKRSESQGLMTKCICIETNNYAEYRAIRDMMGKEPVRKLPEPMKFSIGNMYCSNYFKCTCCHKWFEIYDDIDENYMCISCSKGAQGQSPV